MILKRRQTGILILILIFLAGCVFFYRLVGISKILHPKHIILSENELSPFVEQSIFKDKDDTIAVSTPTPLEYSIERLSVDADDKIVLNSWYIYNRGNAGIKAILLLHDYSESKAQLLPLIVPLLEQGFSTLLPDLRAHGNSGGEISTLGKLESQDLVKIIKDFKGRNKGVQLSILSYGLSNSIVLQASTQLDSLVSLILINPFPTLSSYLEERLAIDYPYLPEFVQQRMVTNAYRRLKIDKDSISYLDLYRKISIPSLIIFDKSLPVGNYDSTKVLSEVMSNTKKEFWVTKGSYSDKEPGLLHIPFFNKISSFVNKYSPKLKRKVRFKRMA